MFKNCGMMETYCRTCQKSNRLCMFFKYTVTLFFIKQKYSLKAKVTNVLFNYVIVVICNMLRNDGFYCRTCHSGRGSAFFEITQNSVFTVIMNI